MTYYGLTSRNGSTYNLPNQNTGVLLKEDGESLLLEGGAYDGYEILLENPRQDVNLSARNVSAYTLPSRN